MASHGPAIGSGLSPSQLAAAICEATDDQLLHLARRLPCEQRELLTAALTPRPAADPAGKAADLALKGPAGSSCSAVDVSASDEQKQPGIEKTPQADVEARPIIEDPVKDVHQKLVEFFKLFSTEATVKPVGRPEAGDPEHLCLGMELSTVVAYLLHTGLFARVQPERYDSDWLEALPESPLRDSFFASFEASDFTCRRRATDHYIPLQPWFSSAFPHVKTDRCLVGYDVCEGLRDFHRRAGSSSWNDVASVEVLLHQGCPFIDLATHFLSHSQAESVDETLTAMYSYWLGLCISSGGPMTVRFFLDYFNIRQNLGGDFKPATVQTVIQRIGRTAVVLIPMETPTTTSRCWCVFELSCSVQGRCAIEAAVAAADKPESYFDEHGQVEDKEWPCIQLEHCDARDPKDKKMVLTHIENGIGIQATNRSVHSVLRQSLENWWDAVRIMGHSHVGKSACDVFSGLVLTCRTVSQRIDTFDPIIHEEAKKRGRTFHEGICNQGRMVNDKESGADLRTQCSGCIGQCIKCGSYFCEFHIGRLQPSWENAYGMIGPPDTHICGN
eukprot:TRINITY_DN7009_c1_g3_i1.p1 TRINITY_DN7009_c1_g3~~TRINITY_DN7009_c1_g3_i1.p1  ORF type:complete len:557 (-),score=48.36 TRINITY_DN7009_c1_g3_i1:135-1805(-)